MADGQDNERGFTLHYQTMKGTKQYVIRAPSKVERDRWVVAIKDRILSQRGGADKSAALIANGSDSAAGDADDARPLEEPCEEEVEEGEA